MVSTLLLSPLPAALTSKEEAKARRKAMTQHEDWKRCNDLYCNWMGFECVESGYDSQAAWEAKEPYIKACIVYRAKYGVAFSSDAEPETSILEDTEELGLRVEYAKYLETCRSRGMDFEEWKTNQEVMD
jgi:hypothetical protein